MDTVPRLGPSQWENFPGPARISDPSRGIFWWMHRLPARNIGQWKMLRNRYSDPTTCLNQNWSIRELLLLFKKVIGQSMRLIMRLTEADHTVVGLYDRSVYHLDRSITVSILQYPVSPCDTVCHFPIIASISTSSTAKYKLRNNFSAIWSAFTLRIN